MRSRSAISPTGCEGAGRFVQPWPTDETHLSLEQRTEFQRLLVARGPHDRRARRRDRPGDARSGQNLSAHQEPSGRRLPDPDPAQGLAERSAASQCAERPTCGYASAPKPQRCQRLQRLPEASSVPEKVSTEGGLRQRVSEDHVSWRVMSSLDCPAGGAGPARCPDAGASARFARARARAQGSTPVSAAISIHFPTATAIASSCSATRSATACGRASIAPSRTTPRSNSSSAPSRRPVSRARLLRLEQPSSRRCSRPRPTRSPSSCSAPTTPRPIRSGKDWLKVGSEGWREIYGQRVEAFIKKLRAANIAVYWVGLPIMRSPGQNGDAEVLNEVYPREGVHQRRQVRRHLERLRRRGRALQRLRPRHDRAGQAAQGR